VSIVTSASASSGTATGSSPALATGSQPAFRRSSNVTELAPKASRTRSISNGSGSWLVNTIEANSPSKLASALARDACSARLAAWLTTSATRTATSTMTTSVITFSLSAMVKVYRGGVRKKLSNNAEATAASSAGPNPPIKATTTTDRTNIITSVGSPKTPRPVTETIAANAGKASAKNHPSSVRGADSGLIIHPVLIDPVLIDPVSYQPSAIHIAAS
jgi:hypothetical protein